MSDAAQEIIAEQDAIRVEVRERLAAKAAGVPHWPHDLETTVDHSARAKYKDVRFQLDRLKTRTEEIEQDKRLSAEGKQEKLQRLKAEVRQEIERRASTQGAEGLRDTLHAEIDSLTKRALTDPGRQQRYQSILTWISGQPPEARGSAWKIARTDNDAEFIEALYQANPTIRKILLPHVKQTDLDGIREQIRQRYAPQQYQDLQKLDVEISTLQRTISNALKRL